MYWILLFIFLIIAIDQVIILCQRKKYEKKEIEKQSKFLSEKIQQLKEQNEIEIKKIEQEYQDNLARLKRENDERQESYRIQDEAARKTIDELMKRAESEKEKCLITIQNAQNEVDQTISNYELARKSEIDEIDSALEQKAIDNFENILKTYETEITESQNKLNDINASITSCRAIQQSINERILELKYSEEQQRFYQICLDEDQIRDIQLLRDVKEKLKCREKIDKIIYDAYVAKPVLELVRRVTQNKRITGIYKITYLPTGESYIGKSVDIGTRWKNHVKSAFGLEGVADSVFQRALKSKGVENFMFTIIEEVDQSILSEREQYWIDYYDTTKVGFNQRSEKK